MDSRFPWVDSLFRIIMAALSLSRVRFRRLRSLLAVTFGVVALGACEGGAVAPELATASSALHDVAPVPAPPIAPVLLASAPTYPPLAIYIVYREYVHRNPGLTRLSPDDRRYQAYMERRLRELYPDRGYPGMMRDARAEARLNEVAVQRYEREMDHHTAQTVASSSLMSVTSSQCGTTTADPNEGADSSWVGQTEFPVPPDEQLPTLQMEIDSLQLVGVEIQELYYYESLATGSYAPEPGSGGGGGGGGGGSDPDDPGIYEPLSAGGEPTRDDLIRAAAGGRTAAPGEVAIQVDPVLIGAISLGVVGAWKGFRVQQAADRAIARSEAYYPTLSAADTKRDAYRHIYLSMMLRRYVGATAAKIITDLHENDSNGPEKVMDLHNNDIGRSHRYNAFRGHWFWDRWDHNEWSVKVRGYINNESANGVYISEWDQFPNTSTEAAWARRACVPVAAYIFFER